MGETRGRKELQPVEDFRRALEEEVSVSVEFDLPLCVLVLTADSGWEPDAVRRVLDSLRVADLVARTGACELTVALPNTVPADAGRVGRRLAKAAPDVGVGISARAEGDSAESLLDAARRAASPENA